MIDHPYKNNMEHSDLSLTDWFTLSYNLQVFFFLISWYTFNY